MNAQQLWFTNPFQVELREQQLSAPESGQVLVRTLYSGISAGTEMLVYRGQIPESMSLDASLDEGLDEGLVESLDESLDAIGTGQLAYPLQYGYACVGVIEQVGSGVSEDMLGVTVFSFQPHASHFVCPVAAVIPVPEGVDPKAAVFLANMETAVNLVLDAKPLIGEHAVVLGQGVLGLLTTSLLAQFPLASLLTVDAIEMRRSLSKRAGAMQVFDPNSESAIDSLQKHLGSAAANGGADIVLELTGAPAALNVAVASCGYAGRIVVGSWYGSKRAEINLGERFHRHRMSIVSSQVSTIAPELTGRWDKARRFTQAWEMIGKCQPEQFISHSLPISRAAEAYQLLDANAADAVQVIFDYSGA